MTLGTAYAVIGAGYGDEGKGLATDYLVRELTKKGPPPLVARCNGGAQAGHTVVDDQRRHVFGHFGSGTFAGADTYLSSNFIVNPVIFNNERLSLTKFEEYPNVYAHPDCRVTTIFDMAINSLVEIQRGATKHGSCGMGINETVTRHLAGYVLTMDMIKNMQFPVLRNHIEAMQVMWIESRLRELNLPPEENNWRDQDTKVQAALYYRMFNVDPGRLARDLQENAEQIEIADPKVYLEHRANDMVVEGAQGLAIDEFLGEFPYVTRSITGLASHVVAAHECGFHTVQPLYITRAYQTRHGAGPLTLEGTRITDKMLYDSTNVDNKWQGSLRYAPLNVDKLMSLIEADWDRANITRNMTGSEILDPKLMVTCLDQLGESVNIIHLRSTVTVPKHDLIETLQDILGIEVVLASRGPTARDVKMLAPWYN